MNTVHEMLVALSASGYTQRELGAQVGMPQEKVSRWLTHGPPEAAEIALRIRDLYVAETRRRQVRHAPSKRALLAFGGVAATRDDSGPGAGQVKAEAA